MKQQLFIAVIVIICTAWIRTKQSAANTGIRLGSDCVVAFDLNVGTPVQAKIIQPDGSETPFDFPMPVTSLKQLEWEPLTGSCP